MASRPTSALFVSTASARARALRHLFRRGAVVNRARPQRAQAVPRQVAGVEGIAIKDDDVHGESPWMMGYFVPGRIDVPSEFGARWPTGRASASADAKDNLREICCFLFQRQRKRFLPGVSGRLLVPFLLPVRRLGMALRVQQLGIGGCRPAPRRCAPAARPGLPPCGCLCRRGNSIHAQPCLNSSQRVTRRRIVSPRLHAWFAASPPASLTCADHVPPHSRVPAPCSIRHICYVGALRFGAHGRHPRRTFS